jgi:glycerol uptake facilitator-like aquaporin
MPPLVRRLLAEAVGSAVLAAVVIGSGIAAQTLSPGDVGVELLENALVTAGGLYVLILLLAPVSGAHFNPVVSFADVVLGRMRLAAAASYAAAQLGGCCLGALLANAMFSRAVFETSHHHRMSGGHWLAELVATAGLLLVIFGLARNGNHAATPAAVAAYIGAAYFFTSSTSFANPAITVGRMLSDTFAGIAPASAPGYVSAQIAGGAVGLALVVALFPARPRPAGGDQAR